ncbi:MAG: TolC family protein [Tannerella sp.]|jgi:outer membrane protein TolC|nr:TolC family protein [Tannerella sp.]
MIYDLRFFRPTSLRGTKQSPRRAQRHCETPISLRFIKKGYNEHLQYSTARHYKVRSNLYLSVVCRHYFVLFFWGCSLFSLHAQQPNPVSLTLQQTIALAGDSSLEAFRSKNIYMSNYWGYKAFQAGRLPSLTLNLTPGQYDRTIVKRYNSEENVDIFRPQQAYEAYGGVSVVQNFDLLGGTFFLNTNLDYLRNFGDNTYTQYTSVPVRIGYQQDLLGYNAFKWQKKIEPLKYEKAKKQLIYDLENTSGLAATCFFNLAMAQAEYDLAQENVHNTDTLYRIGEERYKIAAISQSELLTLRLDRINAGNSLKNADISLKRAMFALTSFLNIDKDTPIRLTLPSYPKSMDISAEKALEESRANNPDFMGYKQNILEQQQVIDRTKKESMFNASIYASVGYNQVASSFSDVYVNPLRQDIISVSLSIPLVDWGVRRGRYNMAKNNLNVMEITARQGEIKIEEDVIMTVGDFNIQKDMITSAEEALVIAEDAYTKTQQRFMIGKTDISALTLSRQRQQEARRNYIRALENYWVSYFKIRKLTLYDFEYNMPITIIYDL